MPGDPRQYIYQNNRLLMYFNIVKFGINLLVTILLAPLSLKARHIINWYSKKDKWNVLLDQEDKIMTYHSTGIVIAQSD